MKSEKKTSLIYYIVIYGDALLCDARKFCYDFVKHCCSNYKFYLEITLITLFFNKKKKIFFPLLIFHIMFGGYKRCIDGMKAKSKSVFHPSLYLTFHFKQSLIIIQGVFLILNHFLDIV